MIKDISNMFYFILQGYQIVWLYVYCYYLESSEICFNFRVFYIHFMCRTFSSCIESITTYIARVACFPAFFNVFIYRAFADIFMTDRTEFVLDTSL